jgi:FtsP/CotA-like multicopper oxidase with cupredoxin domain
MKEQSKGRTLTRRSFFRLLGGAVAITGAGVLGDRVASFLLPERTTRVAEAADRAPDMFLAGTDGWIHMPETPAIPPFHPDPYAVAPLTTYIFGFHNLTGLQPGQIAGRKTQAQHTAPLWWLTEGQEFHLKLTNLGFSQRPDLVDAHTVHFHGMRDAIPYFDGEPHGSVAVPPGKEFTYVYRPHDPGTYMYHCHVEDVEHVQMGMAGMVFVRPAANPKWAYNDPATAFDREFSMMLTEIWAEAHWADAHIQLPEWSDYHPDFSLLNGRVYPDTIAPNGSIDPFNPSVDVDGNMLPPAGHPELQYQPLSSLVRCNAGERVLLRFASLAYNDASMTLPGIRLRIIGKDATPMRGRGGADTSYYTHSLEIHAGASYDALFTAPAFQAPGTPDPDLGNAPYNTYLLYNRAYQRSNNLAPGGFGGQMTEVRVYPAGAVPAQTLPNT